MKKVILLLLILTSCSDDISSETTIERDYGRLLGKRITIEGTAANDKHGALVLTNDDTSIWVDELDSWPPEYFSSGNNGKVVIVTGVITEKNSVPVNIQSSGGQVPGGTNTSGTTSRRYVMKDATWQIAN